MTLSISLRYLSYLELQFHLPIYPDLQSSFLIASRDKLILKKSVCGPCPINPAYVSYRDVSF